jgi:hypothetical protein
MHAGIRYVLLVVGTLLWMVAYTLLGQSAFWVRPLGTWRIVASATFFALAALLSWTGARARWVVSGGLTRV